MKNTCVTLWIIICTVSLMRTAQSATPFEPLFSISALSGDCAVRAGTEAKFVAVEEGKGYAYGSTLKTGPKSKLTVEFSKGNVCELSAGAVVTVNEDPKDRTRKIVTVEAGKVNLTLAQGFDESNKLTVETLCTGATPLTGGKFAAEVTKEAELTVASVLCLDGQIKVFGPYFEVPTLEKDGLLTVACSPENGFTRLKDVHGSFKMTCMDDQGKTKEVALEAGTIVKIWRKPAETGGWMATILISTADGKIKDTISFIDRGGQVAAPPMIPPAAPTPGAEGKPPVAAVEPPAEGGAPQWSEIVSPSSREAGSVGTTPPDITPTGKR